MPLGELNDSGQGFLVNDTCIIEGDVTVTHVYTIIKVIRDADLVEQIGKDIYFDLVDHKNVRGFHIQKQKPFYLFKVGQLSDSMNKTHGEELKLFLEVEFGPYGRLVCSPEKTKEDILIFFKLYDPKDEKLRNSCLNLTSCVTGLMISVHGNHTRLKMAILFASRKPLSMETNNIGILVSYHFCNMHKLARPTEENFCLELSKKSDTYDDVVKRMAHRLSLDDPTKIRLTAHDCHSEQPKSHPVRYWGFRHLQDMLIHNHQTTDILYYEVLDIPLPEFQCLKTLKLAYYHPSDEMTMHDMGLLKQNTVGDLLRKLKTQMQSSDSYKFLITRSTSFLQVIRRLGL